MPNISTEATISASLNEKLPFLPFAMPDIGEEEIAEVVDSLRSGWVTTGPKTKKFEQQFVDFLGQDVQAIAVSSATAGLHLALEAIGIGPGDEVITTPHTFTATAAVVKHVGAEPIFVDIDMNTLCIAPELIESAITPRTKAIMPVHYGGRACEMEEIFNVAHAHGLKVIEDAAHAIPTIYKGQLVGTLGSDATVFSFYATKTITTGEGGMLVTRNHNIAARSRVMRLHGINRDAFDRYTSSKPAWFYDVVAPGFKYNMTDINAAIGIQQLKKARRFQERRQQIALRYDRELEDLPVRLPPGPRLNDQHAWHLYVLCLDESAAVKRDEFIAGMHDRGIGCSVHYIPLHQHSYWRSAYMLSDEMFPNTTKFSSGNVSLPIYTKMTDDDQTRVISAVRSLLVS